MEKRMWMGENGRLRGGEEWGMRMQSMPVDDSRHDTEGKEMGAKGRNEMEVSDAEIGVPQAWEKAIELLQKGETLTSTIQSVNKSGVLVRVGKLSGFVPYKLMNRYNLESIEKSEWSKELIGREIQVKVTQVVVPERRLICSEKAVMLQRAAQNLKKGDVIRGEIASLHNFGAFVEIAEPKEYAGTEVILPLRELSWDWVASVGSVVSKGQRVAVKVVDVSVGPQCKVVVSLKRMEGDPLEDTLDSVMPLEDAGVIDAENLDGVPVDMPQGVEDILDELSKESGVKEVTLGRRVEERRTVSQDLELWMSKEAVSDGFNLIARAGRVVQEIHVQTDMNAEAMRSAVQQVLKRVN